jgi:hypothetical protein
VEEHGGTLHQIIGDGIMALFGAPDSAPAQEQATRAVRMAVAMQREVARLGERWRESGLDHHIQVRMGIHQDYATVGNVGSEHLMSYAAIGSAVNLSSRLESACRPGCILVSYPIYALTRHEHRYGPLVEREFKGFTRLVKVAELDPGVAFGEVAVAAPCGAERILLRVALDEQVLEARTLGLGEERAESTTPWPRSRSSPRSFTSFACQSGKRPGWLAKNARGSAPPATIHARSISKETSARSVPSRRMS